MARDEESTSRRAPDLEDVSSLARLPLHSTDLLTVLDDTGVILYESPSIDRLYGFDQDELVGERSADYFHPEDRDRVVAAFATIVSEECHHVETVEYRHLQADGSYTWIESVGSSNPTPDGHYVINSRDVSQRKRRERELRRTRERVQSERDGKEAIRRLLLRTSTDREIAAEVCRLLAETDDHEAAWVVRERGATRNRSDPVVVADHGSDHGFRRRDGEGIVDAATRRTLATEQPVTITTDAEDEAAVGAQLEQCGLYSVRSAPLEYEGLSYGALTVVRTDPGSEVAEQLMDEITAALAFKQQVHRRRDAFTADTVTELRLRYTGEHVLTVLSARLHSDEFEPELVVEELRGSDDAGTTYLVKTAAVDAATLRAAVDTLPSTRGTTVVTETDTAAVVLFRVETRSISRVLGGYGGILQSITARDGRMDLVAEFPRRTDVGAVVDTVQEYWPEATLQACKNRTVDDDHSNVLASLTKKQEDALRAASLSGFFARPQEASAEAVAETLGISASTFLHHLRNAEQTVFRDVFTHGRRSD
jgi:PAS domain S-box-containing protein